LKNQRQKVAVTGSGTIGNYKAADLSRPDTMSAF